MFVSISDAILYNSDEHKLGNRVLPITLSYTNLLFGVETHILRPMSAVRCLHLAQTGRADALVCQTHIALAWPPILGDLKRT